MLLSKSCIYGLRAALLMASTASNDYISIKEMSKNLNISFHFLTKVLQQLTAANLMESHKGPKGGIRLAKPVHEIALLHIVIAIDGYELFTKCVLGLPGCGVEKPCPMHAMWSEKKEKISHMLESTTLFELAEDVKNGKLRITANGDLDFLNLN
ncbi:MAG TPA: Rrf2 family transcriptional regulator [Balneolaceae bacterium]|nr:Rrf2 family transcriptional regulator [Balneolaceae bacterium]